MYMTNHCTDLFSFFSLAQELADLIRSSHDFMSSIAKAKTAKLRKFDTVLKPTYKFTNSFLTFFFSIVRSLIDMFNEIPGCLPLQIQVCKENIDWANEDKRIFLKQSLETRLVALYLDNKMYHESLSLISQLLKELKRLDDKMVLVEVQLLESRVCHALRNLPKARVSEIIIYIYIYLGVWLVIMYILTTDLVLIII